jgi:hypothetical protein
MSGVYRRTVARTESGGADARESDRHHVARQGSVRDLPSARALGLLMPAGRRDPFVTAIGTPACWCIGSDHTTAEDDAARWRTGREAVDNRAGLARAACGASAAPHV